MTNFEKIKNYYKNFNEKDRLISDSSGKFEYEMTMRILKEYLPKDAKILDLGEATGVYTFPLSKMGYKMYLADLSEKLIEEAKNTKEMGNYENVVSCDVINAINLSKYEDNQFDVVLLFGPLYHLLDKEERNKCISEVKRVLKSDGIIFASFIPYLSGSIAIIDRYFRHPEQVNIEKLKEVFDSGKFNNLADTGFQEGYYPTSMEIENLFKSYEFEKIQLMSIRGFGYEREEKLYGINDTEMFEQIINIISKTSTSSEIIEMCGHAMYIGSNKK